MLSSAATTAARPPCAQPDAPPGFAPLQNIATDSFGSSASASAVPARPAPTIATSQEMMSSLPFMFHMLPAWAAPGPEKAARQPEACFCTAAAGSAIRMAATAGRRRRHRKPEKDLNRQTQQKEREAALRRALEALEKKHGKGAIMRMGEQIEPEPGTSAASAISTGSIGLDLALGIGGLPRGRVVEIYGPESSGKTTIALQVIAQAQKAGGEGAFIDAEHALDPSYAAKLGIDIPKLLLSQPDSGEQALEIVDALVRSGGVDVIVIDSVAALTPKAEIDGEMGDSHVGLHARLMSQALRKLTGTIKTSNTMVIFINQIRMKIGVMYGNPETTTGGNALKFYASVRLDIRRIGPVKQGDEIIGNETRVRVVKNKLAPPFRNVLFEIIYGEGVSRESELIELGLQHRLVQRSGAWYSCGGERIGQGRDNARRHLVEHPAVAEKLAAEIMAQEQKPDAGAVTKAAAGKTAATKGSARKTG